MKVYSTFFPGELFYFQTHWAMSGEEINKALKAEIYSGVDLKPDQVFRYFEGKDGAIPNSIHIFSPGYQLNYVRYLKQRWKSIQKNIHEESV